MNELNEQWHYSSLERIFIEKQNLPRYTNRNLGRRNCCNQQFSAFVSHLKRAVTEEDILKLTEIRIKRISKFDIDKAAGAGQSRRSDCRVKIAPGQFD
ncbi:MAG: hypothetical protein U5K51_14280 [Flavobacteriaceae bacterium]|nr:hypothetical protein [Flavobacteriaceae bacterium]